MKRYVGDIGVVELEPQADIWPQTYNVLWATMEQYLKQGLVSESRVLDIKHVEVSLIFSLKGITNVLM